MWLKSSQGVKVAENPYFFSISDENFLEKQLKNN